MGLAHPEPGCKVVDAGHAGKTYLPVGGTVTVPVSVKSHQLGDATYCVRVNGAV